MKKFGVFLLVIGIILGTIAFNLDTSVETESQFIGDIYIPSQKVNNLGRMDEKRNYLMLSGLIVLVGAVFFGFSTIHSPSSSSFSASSSSEEVRKCPFCAELVKVEAVICRFCQKDLPSMQVVNPQKEINKIKEKTIHAAAVTALSTISDPSDWQTIDDCEDYLRTLGFEFQRLAADKWSISGLGIATSYFYSIEEIRRFIQNLRKNNT